MGIKYPIADVAFSKRPLLFTVWTQLRLRSHQIFYEIFTRKQFLPTSASNAQAQLHGSCTFGMINRERLELATSPIGTP